MTITVGVAKSWTHQGLWFVQDFNQDCCVFGDFLIGMIGYQIRNETQEKFGAEWRLDEIFCVWES